MADRPNPVFRIAEELSLIGTMATYNTQTEASEGIPQQWREFLRTHPALQSSSRLCGASPCTSDRKIHYLTGIPLESPESVAGGELLTLEAGEYAVVRVNDGALLRDTWIWLLSQADAERSESASFLTRSLGLARKLRDSFKVPVARN